MPAPNARSRKHVPQHRAKEQTLGALLCLTLCTLQDGVPQCQHLQQGEREPLKKGQGWHQLLMDKGPWATCLSAFITHTLPESGFKFKKFEPQSPLAPCVDTGCCCRLNACLHARFC